MRYVVSYRLGVEWCKSAEPPACVGMFASSLIAGSGGWPVIDI